MIFVFIQSDKFSSLKQLRVVAQGDTNYSVFPLLAIAANNNNINIAYATSYNQK